MSPVILGIAMVPALTYLFGAFLGWVFAKRHAKQEYQAAFLTYEETFRMMWVCNSQLAHSLTEERIWNQVLGASLYGEGETES